MLTSQKILLSTGFDCNNNCIICSVAHCRNAATPGTGEIKKRLLAHRKAGFMGVEFIGGEPSIRKDIRELVAFARHTGFRDISMTTNGRMFSYKDFCERIFEAGLNEVSFSLLGDRSHVHDAVTRCRGSFSETISGIKNALSCLGRGAVTVNTVLQAVNSKRMKAMAGLIANLGIGHWEIQALLPEGAAKQVYAKCGISLKDLKACFRGLEACGQLFDCISFHDFPFCGFTKKMLRGGRFKIDSDNDRLFLDRQGPKGHTMEAAKAGYRTKTPACKACVHDRDCPGMTK